MSSSLDRVTSSRMLRVADTTPANLHVDPHATRGNSDAPPLRDLDIVAAVGKALAASGLSHKDAAALMDLDKAHWSRQLNGADNQHISFQRMVRSLPRAFWLALLHELSAPLDVVIASPDIADRAMHQLLLATEAACTYARQDRALRERGRR